MDAAIPLQTSPARGAAHRVAWGQVAGYVALAYGLSWLWWAPVVLPRLGGLSLTAPLPDLARDPAVARVGLGMFGPLLAAVAMRLFVSREGIRGSLGVLRPWRWYAIAIAGPALFIAAVIAIDHVSGLGRFVWSRPVPLALAYPLIVLLNGALGVPLTFGEEYGWRGYLLPRLLPLGEVRATLLLGVIWATWHVPAILLGLNYPHQPAWAALLVFALNVLLLSFPFTWLFVASEGSVLVVAVLHAVANAAGDTFTTPAHIPEGNALIVGGAGLVPSAMVLAVVAAVYGVLRRRTTAADPERLRLPRRKGDRLDWLR